MKNRKIIAVLLLSLLFMVFAIGSGEDTSTDSDQGEGVVETKGTTDNTSIGDYSVEIKDCRLAKDYDGKDVIIVKYIFKNVADDEPASFDFTFDDAAFQNGVGLNEAYFLADSANYNGESQSKEIKKGASLEVEVAYELNDTSTDVEIEVKELFSFEEKTISKTFKITE